MSICEACLHRVVCDIYKATGGVNKCEHHAEERHGRWVWDNRFHDYTCSECHNWDLKTPNYCSNCGTPMDGGNTDG